MKHLSTLKHLLLFFISVTLFARAGAQALTEDFSYTNASTLISNGYISISGTGTNTLTVSSPSLSFGGSPSSGVGGAVSMTTNGEDVTKTFSPTINSGTAYASFLINVSAAASGDYFFALYDAGGFKARVFIKSTTGGYFFGIAKNSTTATYETNVRSLNTTYLVVLKYVFNTGNATDDVVSLYVNPTLGSPEPGTATIAGTTSSGSADATTIDRIALRQGSSGSASAQVIDAIRVGTTWASVTPVSNPTTTSIAPTNANAGSPGFTLTVNGTNFVNGSTVTWNGSNRTTTYVSSTQITADIPASDLSAAGTAVVGVTTTGAASVSNTQTFTINAVAGGTFTLTSPLADFANICTNTTAGPNSFTLDGNNLDGSNSSTVTISALAGFTYSLSAGGSYTSTLSFTYSGNSFTGTVIYVKFTPTAVQSYNGNILINGGGVSNYPVTATGSGINNPPTVTTGSSSAIGATTATVAGTINNVGCAAISTYGIEYSLVSGFANGAGTQVTASNLNSGNFSVNLSGLTPNARTYYKAYATNSIGTTYGTEQAFNNTPLPVVLSAQPNLSYTQDFADIATWSNFFITGNGANHFGGLSANASGTIPDGIKITGQTNTFQGSTFGSSSGVQRGTDQSPPTTSIVLLSTGASPENSSSAAIDFYMDFTGVNAGTLSFDYASINNSTGDRNGSLRVYATTDGVTFTDIPFADVLNFTNNSTPVISGSKSNIALPASFNNSATARLRFYYSNGTGGTTGSRPKISIDNLTVTAVATTPCSAPTASPTALNFGTINDVSIQGSFTAASPSADQYLVIASVNSSLTGNPVDGQIYNLGDNVGDGTVVAKGSGTSFTATGLTASTLYYFFIFSTNSVCTGGPLYLTSSMLTGQASTTAGLPPCSAPASQASGLTFGTVGVNSIQGSFTATTANEYLVLRTTAGSLSATPVNGQQYNAGDILGNATVVQRSSATSFAANALTPGTSYNFFIFSLNSQNCINGPAYNINSPLNGSQSTNPLPACVTPTTQPSVLTFNASANAVSGAFSNGSGADDYLVVRSTASSLSASPVNSTDYNTGDNLGGGVVVSNASDNVFMSTNLTASTTYYFFVFAANKNCSGGTQYLTSSPLSGSITTTSDLTLNYYFGTLHSHSDYSDGNQDHPGYTPTNDYTYAMTAQCMDYLGISEHNHFSNLDNPGNTIGNYHSGSVEANAFTSAHPNFLALYGMEWGVISGGGHVVVYGDGMDNLWGWESGAGAWGPTNNYDVFVAKSDYTGANGLFKTVNDNLASNTFATLAHPNNSDFNNLASSYNAVADNAITGVAVESGPATSTSTTYSNPGSSLFYLPYYQLLLSKGYHLGPTIDHDNHKTTFGHTTYSRTSIIAPALTKTELVKSMRNMHFYATQDCDTKVDFMINTKLMGSILTDRYAPVISVTLTDATTSTSSAVIRLMFGVPGSGVVAYKLDSAIGNSMKYVDNSLANMTTGYYYLDIVNGSAHIITAPIWYSRNDNNTIILPVKLLTFNAAKAGSSVDVTWSTSGEMNAKNFTVERSVDGSKYQALGKLTATGNSTSTVRYSFKDQHPNSGNNFYRLRMTDLDNKFELSKVIRIDFSKAYTISIAPNPARENFIISLTNMNEPLLMEITNMNGKIVKSQTITQQNTKIDIQQLAKGLYLIKVTGHAATYTEKLIVE